MSRFDAMIKQCKKKGGSCPCTISCSAEGTIEARIKGLQSQIANLDNKLKYLRHIPCAVRSDWKMPKKPDGDYEAAAYQDSDGWHPHWYSETEQDDYIEFPSEASWPFVEEIAYGEDWERIGFVTA